MDMKMLSQMWKMQKSEYNYANALCDVAKLKAVSFMGWSSGYYNYKYGTLFSQALM